MTAATDTLLFCDCFFDYAREIKRHLEQRGRHVSLFNDRPSTDSLTKALIRLAPAMVRRKTEKYFEEIIEKMRGQPIRDVLVIKGESVSPAIVTRLRMAFPDARFTLYFWDSYRNMPADSRSKVSLFDRVLTFDPQDAAADKRLIYRPLFFVESFSALPELPQDIDVLFFGSMHGDRYTVLRRIERALPVQLKFVKFVYFSAKWLRFAYALGDPALLLADSKDFIFAPKSRTELAELVARSRCVVDIERPVQCGYTMRTIEILRTGRKLISTNAELANADFYTPANIAIIDRRRPILPKVFFESPGHPVPPEILDRYSLDSWLDEVLPPLD